MKNHRFILEPYSGKNSRHFCPSCGSKVRTFTLYFDTILQQNIAATVGKCSRENNCGYHYTPKQFFADNKGALQNELSQQHLMRTKLNQIKGQQLKPNHPPCSFIPLEQFKDSLRAYGHNYFVQFLLSQFGEATTTKLIEDYFIGTSKYWQGATVFWQVDIACAVRTGKIMQYCPSSGKRIKEPFNHIQWVHKLIGGADFALQQCFFGEHLLLNNIKPVAIVESEKTAIIASAYMPDFIWLATGSLNNLSAEKCAVLKGRNVILFPDLNAFDKWSAKAQELVHITSFLVSDLLERNATDDERKDGLDVVDYLLKG